MYTLNLYDSTMTELVDATMPPTLSFVDQASAVNYAVRHIERSGNLVTAINDVTGAVTFTVDTDGNPTQYYVASLILDIRTTQYAILLPAVHSFAPGGRLVLSTDELDDIISVLLWGFIDHAVVNSAKRQAALSALLSSIKTTVNPVTFESLSDPDTYNDITALTATLRTMLVS